jgi:cytochrome c5
MNRIIILGVIFFVLGCGATKNQTNSTPEVKTVETKPQIIPEIANKKQLNQELVLATSEAMDVKALYESKCAKCHELPKPKSHSAFEWKPILDRMQPMAEITDEEKSAILSYVTQ